MDVASEKESGRGIERGDLVLKTKAWLESYTLHYLMIPYLCYGTTISYLRSKINDKLAHSYVVLSPIPI